jgi:molybdopterin-guanine dinucleotide biosynthesis protein A
VSRGVIVLAGGQSSRMGTDKWKLPIGGRAVLERIGAALSCHVEETWVVLPFGAEETVFEEVTSMIPEARILRDETPDAGPLAGIEVGLRRSGCDANLVVAADMPFVRWPVAELLFRACEQDGVEVAVPMFQDRMHPLFAVYRKRALPSLLAYRRQKGKKVMEWVAGLASVTVGEETLLSVDQEPSTFFNMNTPEDYERVKRNV